MMNGNVTSLLTGMLFCLASLLNGQNEIQTAFSMIGGSNTAIEQEQLREEGSKFEIANRVYKRLIAAKGDRRFTPPAFYIASGEKFLAFMEADGLSIGLEEKAFDLCMEMGEDALAAVLGHELSHFYEKHGFDFNILSEFQDEKTGEAVSGVRTRLGNDEEANAFANDLLNSIDRSWSRLIKLSNETESDYLGGFLAYSAGYSVDKLPEMYGKLYEGYGLKDTIFGYGTLQERQELAQATQRKLDNFIDLFEVANLLISVERFADARVLYKYILREYQGREIYNNLGVLTVMEALSCLGDRKKDFRLPLELDLSFGSSTKGIEAYPPGFFEKLLEEAQYYFQSAASLDADYAPAYLNQAIVYYLREDYTRATFYADVEARDRAKEFPEAFPNTGHDADVLLALITIKQGDKEKGISLLEKASANSNVAAINLKIAKGEELPSSFSDGPEWSIGDLEQDDILVKSQSINKSKDLRIFDDDKLRVWNEKAGLTDAKIYRFKPRFELNLPDVYFMITNPGYDELNFDDLGVGSTAEAVREEYGEPNKIISAVNGEVWAYDETILIFDAEQKVRRYALWLAD